MVLVLIVLGLLSLPSQMASYREQGVLHRMSTTPVPASALLGAQVAVNIVFAVVSFALILGVGAGAFNLVLPVQFGWFVLSLALAVASDVRDRSVHRCVCWLGAGRARHRRPSLLPVGFLRGDVRPAHRVPRTWSGRSQSGRPPAPRSTPSMLRSGDTSPAGRRSGSSPPTRSCSARSPSAGSAGTSSDPTSGAGGSSRCSRSRAGVTLPGDITGEQVTRRRCATACHLASRCEPATKFKGRLFGFGTEPAGPDVILVTTEGTSLGRAQVTVVRASGDHPSANPIGWSSALQRTRRGPEGPTCPTRPCAGQPTGFGRTGPRRR